MTRSTWFGLGCRTIAWMLILFSLEGCATSTRTVVVPSCVPLTNMSSQVQEGAREELEHHPEMTNTFTIVGDWISMRDDDRICLAHRKNVEHAINK